MEGFVKARWAELGAVRVHLMGKGLFVFQMESEEARQGALERGPWSFSRRPLILKPWSLGMALEKTDVDNLPVWVQYPHLPIDLWTPEALSRISSQLGKPLFADRNTSEQRRLGYARVCVEVKVESTLFEEIPIKYVNGYVHYQKVGGKEAVIERDVPSSSGTMQFGAIEVDPATLLPTPVGSVVKERRQDTPVGRGDAEIPAIQVSPIGEEKASGEDELAAESVEQQKGGVGNAGWSKKKGRGNGRVAALPPQPV
ncbi:hypothetical protein LIER_41165 [Lithospermum erythrorhizon]|uniref:DUF4283 domain-containing protein n=1 Tax=Lithospermum erythrorhizon TaxID=34254 RepID=A0AAV3R904_LITER